MIKDYKYTENELEELFINHNKYLAHLSSDEKIKETLFEHLLLVQRYFFKLISVHQLENVIDLLINSISINEKIRLFTKEIFTKSIASHDFGKVNPLFQINKMKNNVESFKHELSSRHSLISGYLFILLSEKNAEKYKFSDEEQVFADSLILYFSYPILKHHSSSLNHIQSDLKYKENIEDLSNFSKFMRGFDEMDFINEINDCVISSPNSIFEDTIDFVNDKFSLFSLLKLNYSLLTASDYLATSHFMNDWGDELLSDFGIFDNKLKRKIIQQVETSTPYNKKTYQKLEKYKLEFPEEPNNDNLNKLRQNLSVETISGIRNNLDKNLFYIEAPTGGGKTNLSMLALAEFLRNDIDSGENKITKVFYVFPFTTLITQTFKSLQETLGLEDKEIVQIHSKAGFSQKGNDDKYGNEHMNIIDYQFVNYPIALLSHIKFFDILKSNRKSANYLMHRLANSIVIIDELQTYSPKEWDKVIYFIDKYARYFNIKFILMSATLPKIDKLLSPEAKKIRYNKESFIALNKNKERYFTNPNFANRIEFDFSLIDDEQFNNENREEYLFHLWEKVRVESEQYKEQSKNNRVHTIIEFIFKKTAGEFIEIANKNKSLFDEIFILSGTTLEPRRKEIISKLKSEEYISKDVLLITTQVVEAGVDIDMDLGFKDTSLIDSDEQLAGRINRNVNKPRCKLFLFDLDDASVIYGKDDRFKIVKENFSTIEYQNMLNTKNFDSVYNAVMKDRNEFNTSFDFVNLKSYIKSIKRLNFNSVHKDFRLIDNSMSTTTIYVPIDIPISIPNSNKCSFTNSELNFLKDRGKLKESDLYVSGDSVWEVFVDVIKNKENDFIKQIINKITLQGLISKFSFSVATYSKNAQNIIASGKGKEEYGFYKLNEPDEVYDYKTGIKSLEFEDINFL